MGGIKQNCTYCCVSSFTVYSDTGTPEYVIKKPECCCGMCIDCCAEGCCGASFYIYNPDNVGRGHELLSNAKSRPEGQPSIKFHRDGNAIARISRLFNTQMFSDADQFELEFPQGAAPEQKGRLLGAVFYLNMLFYEQGSTD